MSPRRLLLLAALAFITTRADALTLLHWNTAGNGTTDWSTNSPQVDAIGRQVMYWRPEVVTFNEIPRTNVWQMANFVTAYLPGYHLATNSGTDGFLRSVILSRYPIARSQKWLENASLAPFGYTNTTSTFARDLFEAEIAVPGWTQHLHVFTTHLKATEGQPGFTNSVLRRAAEASAVSNFFVTTFLPANGQRPYVLTGDLNEDIAEPTSHTGLPIQRLLSAPTGLRLTTPVNPFMIGVDNGSNTYSIRASVTRRLDYILPGGLLFSNIATSQVFRTDKFVPLPPNLLSNDSRTASDHLPVIMSFHNPYDPAPTITSFSVSNQFLHLNWLAVTGRSYRVESTTNLAAWTPVTTNLLAAATNMAASVPRVAPRQYLRVRRFP